MHRVLITFITVQWATITKHFDNEWSLRRNKVIKTKKLNVLKVSKRLKREEKVHNQHDITLAWSSTKIEEWV